MSFGRTNSFHWTVSSDMYNQFGIINFNCIFLRKIYDHQFDKQKIFLRFVLWNSTVYRYQKSVQGANGGYFLAMTLLGATYHKTEIGCFVLSSLIYIACFQFMFRLGKPKTSEPDGKGVQLILVLVTTQIVKLKILPPWRVSKEY